MSSQMEVSMKNMILTMALFSSTLITSAFACDRPEAQFIGTVKNVSVQLGSESTKVCFYEIEFSSFNSSIVCPLDINDVYSEKFLDQSCSLKNGDFVSGYMSLVNGEIVFE